MMDKNSGWIQDYFKGRDGAKIFCRFYPAPGARHTVLMLHGYGEHSGRYEKFPGKMGRLEDQASLAITGKKQIGAGRLEDQASLAITGKKQIGAGRLEDQASLAITGKKQIGAGRLSAQFAAMDFRGMGRSEGARGDIGSFDDYLGDVTAFVEYLRKKHSIPKKFILFGHSLGGLVAAQWAMKDPEPVKLLILSAPLLDLKFSGIIRPLNRLIRVFSPGFIYRDPVRVRALSHDPVEIAAHRKDPLILRQISARLVGEIARRTEALRKQPILSVPFPVHMLVPGEERIVDPKASRLFFDRLVSPRKERTFFEGFFHEIFNEQDQQKAFNVLKTIIEDCV